MRKHNANQIVYIEAIDTVKCPHVTFMPDRKASFLVSERKAGFYWNALGSRLSESDLKKFPFLVEKDGVACKKPCVAVKFSDGTLEEIWFNEFVEAKKHADDLNNKINSIDIYPVKN